MNYTIENDFLKISADSHGGELTSIYSKKTNLQHLWDGNPDYWKYHAPILFPIVGKVLDLKYKVDGIEYTLPQHGLARISEFKLKTKDNNSITFELSYSNETLNIYPYKFILESNYCLNDSSVIVSYKVKNVDDKKIFFSIGSHPAFVCPINNDEKFEDYSFIFSKKESSNIMCLNSEGYFKKTTKPFLNNCNKINLSKELFKNDALVFSDLNSKTITLSSSKHQNKIILDFNNFPYLGLWSPAKGAPFVCIEPWFGHADYEDFNGELKDKEGILSLDKNKTFECSFIITIK